MSILREIRKERKLSGIEVGHQIGIRPATLYRYETNDRKLPVTVAKQLGDLYGVPWSDFYEVNGNGETA